jgi:choline dehydrogenase
MMLFYLPLYLIFVICSAEYDCNPKREQSQNAKSTFDYIIVGGGAAGLVLANRLTENPAIQVAVIEAGEYYEKVNPVFSTTPVLATIGVGADPASTNAIDWNFTTIPQTGLGDRTIHYSRGKCLGGR